MKKRSGITGPAICVILLLFLALPEAALTAGQGEGYDENTEVTVTGTIGAVFKEARGPVIVRVVSYGRTYNVFTGPPWFLSRQSISLRPGKKVEVTGSKVLYRDGTLAIISRSLKEVKTGKVIFFRDDFFRPLWRGRRHFR